MPELENVQIPALSLLRDVLGYTIASGMELRQERGSDSEPWLEDRLHSALLRINPGLTDRGAAQALAQLRAAITSSIDPMECNEVAHAILSRWATVEETAAFAGQSPVRRSVRFFDFDELGSNDWLAVSELCVRSAKGDCRMDIVVYCNGLPLVVIECKASDAPHGLASAISDLRHYQSAGGSASRIFATNHFCIALTRHDAMAGAIGADVGTYARWKSLRPFTKRELEDRLERDSTPQDRLLASLLHPDNLLDSIRSFVAFERSGGRLIKKLARWQQWEAVNDTLASILPNVDGAGEIARLSERGGVVWHTQGSGKSLTMLWLSLKLHRCVALENPTILIVTDRVDLDRQITATLRSCGFENPVAATWVAHLRQLLNGPPGQTILTTIQKFQEDRTESAIQAASNPRQALTSGASGGRVIALIDEAHRTEYGVLHARLREALPDACLIAFTGTPIPKTLQNFGGYLHRYTMPQAVEDGATVPILYESRLPKLAVWGKQIDPIFEAEFVLLTEEQRERIKRAEVTERKVGEARERIGAIAFDIYEHFRDNFEADGFKAQVAACSQRAAARYYRELERFLPGRVALLISDPSKDATELWKLKEKIANEPAIIEEFKDPDGDLAILVVVDKYLTGFDAPIERVLYLDRPLQEHGLLQAIARVNRPMSQKDKGWGLVVDYWGVAGFLDKALKSLHDDLPVESIMDRRTDDREFEILKQRLGDALACFPSGLSRKEIEQWIEAIEPADCRAVFHSRYREFYKSLERLLPDPRALQYLDDFAWLRRVRMEARTAFCEEDVLFPDCAERVRALIDRSVRGDEVRVLLAPISLLDKGFSALRKKLWVKRTGLMGALRPQAPQRSPRQAFGGNS
jgi:type I restriction enzyme R subunit